LVRRAIAAEPAGWRVVVNDSGQYSVWPEDRAVPGGWRAAGPAGAKSACLERITGVWTDMRPAGPAESGDGTELGALILGQAARTPGATAVVCGEVRVT
jgi:MbtH protein